MGLRCRRLPGVVRFTTPPYGPDQASQLISDSNSCFVMAAQFLNPKRPTMKTVRLAFGSSSQQYGPRAMDQEHSQIDVSTLADSSEISTLSAGVFMRGQTEIASEMTAGRKTVYLDEGHQSSSG